MEKNRISRHTLRLQAAGGEIDLNLRFGLKWRGEGASEDTFANWRGTNGAFSGGSGKTSFISTT